MPDGEALKVLKEFRGNYEPRPFKNMLQWETVSKRLEYFTDRLAKNLSNAIRSLKEANELASRVSNAKDPRDAAEKLTALLRKVGSSAIIKRLGIPCLRGCYGKFSCPIKLLEEIENALSQE